MGGPRKRQLSVEHWQNIPDRSSGFSDCEIDDIELRRKIISNVIPKKHPIKCSGMAIYSDE